MPTELCILGAGGHGAVVASTARLSEVWTIRIFDENPGKAGHVVAAIRVEHFAGMASNTRRLWHVAIGANTDRRSASEHLSAQGHQLVTITHPRAAMDPAANIEQGVFVAAQAVISVGAVIAEGAIINHSAVVDHDCRVGAWTHIAPGAVLGGGAIVGDGCLIGAAAVVLPGVQIASGAIVGAGSVVTRDVPENAVVAGVPAGNIK